MCDHIVFFFAHIYYTKIFFHDYLIQELIPLNFIRRNMFYFYIYLYSAFDNNIDLQMDEVNVGPVYPPPEAASGSGLFGWISGSQLVNRVMEKTKVSWMQSKVVCFRASIF